MLALLHNGRAVGFASLRPLGLASVSKRVAAKTSLITMGHTLQPQRLNGYVCTSQGDSRRPCDDAPQACGREAQGVGRTLFLLQLDMANTFGSVDYLTMWAAVKVKAGTRKGCPLDSLLTPPPTYDGVGTQHRMNPNEMRRAPVRTGDAPALGYLLGPHRRPMPGSRPLGELFAPTGISSQLPPPQTMWGRWKLFVAPVVSKGAWGWLWCPGLCGKLDALVYVLFGTRPGDTKPWVARSLRSIRGAKAWAWKHEKTSDEQQILLQRVGKCRTIGSAETGIR